MCYPTVQALLSSSGDFTQGPPFKFGRLHHCLPVERLLAALFFFTIFITLPSNYLHPLCTLLVIPIRTIVATPYQRVSGFQLFFSRNFHSDGIGSQFFFWERMTFGVV